MARAPAANPSARVKALHGAGRLVGNQSDDATTRRHFAELIPLLRQRGDMAGLAEALGDLALTMLLQGDTAEALRERLGAPLLPIDLASYEQTVAAIHAHLDEAAFVTAWVEGQTMTLEQAIAYELGETGPE